MKAIQVNYDKEEDKIAVVDDPPVENWAEVCNRYDNDVHRLRDATNRARYTALYKCFDEDNQPHYFLVEEDHRLKLMRRKMFLKKLGRYTE
jgi:hypothetical protein